MKNHLSKREVEYWSALTVGQRVEVYDGTGVTLTKGTIETIAPDLEVAWIFTEGGERKLLHMHEDFLRPT